jgi:uncharacterized protein YydD (DUF2326 family)
MFLKSLKIEKNSGIIRDISFTKGLNLIIDETRTDVAQESGNNVGKTTVLKLIDYCLGGNGDNVYRDVEFKNKLNTHLEDFIKGNNVTVTLILKSDLSDDESQEITIRRNFLARSLKIQEINGEQYNQSEFDKKLKQLIFHTSSEKPTFRQIISKNIRYEKQRLDNTVRVLHATTTFEEYEALYFFWFGIDTDTASRKQKLQLEKSTEEAVLKRLKRETSLSQITQAISIIDLDIRELNLAKTNFNINKDYEADFQSLNNIKSNINKLSTDLGRLEIRRRIIVEAQEELQRQEFVADVEELREIYNSAEALMPEIQVTFEQLVAFHNKMLDEKVNFVTKELPILEQKLADLNSSLQAYLLEEIALSQKLDKAGAIDELESIIKKLNTKYQQKGAYEEQLRQWNTSTEKLERIEEELEEINAGISSYGQDLEASIALFNKYFSKISRKLYGEQFILSQSNNGRAYQLDVSSIGGLGTGKKKGLIAAFDIAYVEFCDEKGIPCLHFILHDQVENIHDNQLTLISEVTNEANVQFIVPVLRDKLPTDINPEQYKVLSLSQDDKLFRIESSQEDSHQVRAELSPSPVAPLAGTVESSAQVVESDETGQPPLSEYSPVPQPAPGTPRQVPEPAKVDQPQNKRIVSKKK